MELKDFTFRLLMLGIPGITCFFLLKKLVGKIGADTVESVLSIFVLAVLCYFATDVSCWAYHLLSCLPWQKTFGNFHHLTALFDATPSLDEKSVLLSTAFAVQVALVVSWTNRKKFWNRFSQWAGMSKRFGDEDLFVLLLDSGPDDGRWYVVRDHKQDLAYYGAIKYWSDDGPDRELILSNVDVFSNEDENGLLYSCKTLYLCRKRDDVSIELDPAPPDNILKKHEQSEPQSTVRQ